MPSSTTTIPTENAARYITQLGKHWAHKYDVVEADGETHIALSICDLRMKSTATYLEAAIHAENDVNLALSKEVFISHLERFAYREAPLAAQWQDHAS